MKVIELIGLLKEYNPEAAVDVVANNHSHDFSLCYGNFERDYEKCEKNNCQVVSIYVDKLNRSESAG